MEEVHNAGIRARSLPETEPRDARMENFIGNLSITHRALEQLKCTRCPKN